MSEYKRAADRWSDFVELDCKPEGPDNRFDYAIVGDALLEMLKRWAQDIPELRVNDCQGRFPIYHPDISVNNLFVDDDYNITCVIDWAFSSSVPLPVLLTSPGLPQSQDQLEPTLLLVLDCGFLNAHHEGLPQNDIENSNTWYRILSQSRPMWPFSPLFNFAATNDYDLFKALWESTHLYDQDISGFFCSKQSLEQYRSLYSELKEDEDTPEQLSAYNQQYFQRKTPEDIQALAIARKLTLVSEWSTRYGESLRRGIRKNGNTFIADKRLWSWIDGCLR